ncbi:MAG: hypothetical protein CMP25_01190 [Rickettsiales bacterium]|nr:hypothetical protein [Rickettsiales bacterium]
MVVKNTKSFIEFCNEIGIKDNIGKKTSSKFIKKFIETENFNTEKNPNTNSKKEKITNLRKKISSLDFNLKETATNCVFSDKNVNSKIMIISGIPNDEEDISGIPFSGKKGEFFDKIFSYIKYSKKNFYISNLIFWRPPGDRKPKIDEIEVCLPLMHELIKIINPEMLIVFGGFTAKYLLKRNEPIAKLRGKLFYYEIGKFKIQSFVMYDLSFLIKNSSKKKNTWLDICKLREIIGKN